MKNMPSHHTTTTHILLLTCLIINTRISFSYIPCKQWKKNIFKIQNGNFKTFQNSKLRDCTIALFPNDDDDNDDGIRNDFLNDPDSNKEEMNYQEPALPPLPNDFLNNGGSGDSFYKPVRESWQYKMEEQQRQIDALMLLVKSQSEVKTASMVTKGTTAVTPLKAMLFIDGTWLYYSVHQRREVDCPIMKKFGRGWQHYYKFDWSILPRIICEQLQEQQTTQGWSSSSTQNQQTKYHRPVEIVRASVYTSYKKNTDKNSLRVRMFQEMIESNYDVHLMETLGNAGEKCVDIQLAVEMLHYATVPNAYDIAIMLSGDKDFVPAMIRTRQKGKQVCIVSMRNGCNRALFESSHIKDYDIIWLDDFLDRLIVPIDEQYDSSNITQPPLTTTNFLSAFLMIKIIHDFVSKVSGGVSSRDIGRFLKKNRIGNSTMLDQMKELYGGLRLFLAQHGGDFFTIYNRDDVVPMSHRDPRDRSFLVEVIDGSEDTLLQEASRTTLSLEEEKFLKSYYEQEEKMRQMDRDDYLNAYYHTFEDPLASEFLESPPDVILVPNDDDDGDFGVGKGTDADYAKIIYSDANVEAVNGAHVTNNVDYSKYTLAMLKQTCRERGLPVSGTKSALMERIINDPSSKQKDQESQYSSVSDSSSPTQQRHQSHYNPMQTNKYRQTTPPRSTYKTLAAENPQLTKHLDDLITEYITASGGHASSRDVGRYLAANPGINRKNSALKELKDNFTSLAQFLNQRKEVFAKVNVEDVPVEKVDDGAAEFKFYIGLR